MSDFCEGETLNDVFVQFNGIIRNSKGEMIGSTLKRYEPQIESLEAKVTDLKSECESHKLVISGASSIIARLEAKVKELEGIGEKYDKQQVALVVHLAVHQEVVDSNKSLSSEILEAIRMIEDSDWSECDENSVLSSKISIILQGEQWLKSEAELANKLLKEAHVRVHQLADEKQSLHRQLKQHEWISVDKTPPKEVEMFVATPNGDGGYILETDIFMDGDWSIHPTYADRHNIAFYKPITPPESKT